MNIQGDSEIYLQYSGYDKVDIFYQLVQRCSNVLLQLGVYDYRS